jgi:hypothetical protein
MLKPAYISQLDKDRMQITLESREGSKQVIFQDHNDLEELLKTEPYEKLNKILIEKYSFLFKKKVSDVLSVTSEEKDFIYKF